MEINNIENRTVTGEITFKQEELDKIKEAYQVLDKLYKTMQKYKICYLKGEESFLMGCDIRDTAELLQEFCEDPPKTVYYEDGLFGKKAVTLAYKEN